MSLNVPSSSSSSPSRFPLRSSNGAHRPTVRVHPGFSLLDWGRLSSKMPPLLPSVPRYRRFTLEDVSQHSSESDMWIVYKGKVYDVTLFAPYHPGGVEELMKGAGKDATDLIISEHSWVNIESMLEDCLIGFLMT